MKIKSFVGTPFQSRSYVIYTENQNKALIVDLGEAKPHVLNFLKQSQLIPQIILLTHGHIDHIAGIADLYKEYKIPIYLHHKDMSLYENVGKQAELFQFEQPKKLPEITNNFEHGEYIHVLDTSFQVLETPGHTLGSVCFYNKENAMVFTGDTLFKGCIGRIGLPGSSTDPSEITRSIDNHLYCLPDETSIYPGHMDYSTIGQEKQNNSFTRFHP